MRSHSNQIDGLTKWYDQYMPQIINRTISKLHTTVALNRIYTINDNKTKINTAKVHIIQSIRKAKRPLSNATQTWNIYSIFSLESFSLFGLAVAY